jgi:hypothetical protein
MLPTSLWSGVGWRQVAAAVEHALFGMNGIMLLLFWGVVALAAVVTYLQVAEQRSIRAFFGYLVPSATIRHPSARADILFWLSRRLFPLMVVPLTFSTIAAGHLTYSVLAGLAGSVFSRRQDRLPPRAPGVHDHDVPCLRSVLLPLSRDAAPYPVHVGTAQSPPLG